MKEKKYAWAAEITVFTKTNREACLITKVKDPKGVQHDTEMEALEAGLAEVDVTKALVDNYGDEWPQIMRLYSVEIRGCAAL